MKTIFCLLILQFGVLSAVLGNPSSLKDTSKVAIDTTGKSTDTSIQKKSSTPISPVEVAKMKMDSADVALNVDSLGIVRSVEEYNGPQCQDR